MNPFVHNGEMLPVASINSVYVDHQKAYDLFRPSLILQELIQLVDQFGLHTLATSTSVLHIFDRLLQHESDTVQQQARDLANHFGDALAKVLCTLHKPSDLSKQNRKNWTEQHWHYWASIKHIYLVGGLTSPLLTQLFYKRISNMFQQQNITDVQVTFIEGSQNMGTRGLASIVTDGDYMLFDFGQTSIKRARTFKQKGIPLIESYLEPIESKYLFYKNTDKKQLFETAKELDEYIISVILQTMRETDFKGDHIYMSVANYVSEGRIYSARGGYGKLAYIAENYQEHLQQKLSAIVGKPLYVTLFHDTSAMALLYRKHPHTAVISLGTAFGVAFPHDFVYS